MTTAFLPLPIFRAFDSAGLPLAGGLLYAYAAGTTTPQATYSDAAGAVPNSNPVVLDSTGSAVVRLGSLGYKFVLTDSTGGTTYWTEDNYIAPAGDSPTFLGTVTATAVSATTVTGTTVNATTLAVSANATVSGTLAVTGQITSHGVALTVGKTSDETRTSNTTVANDSVLTVAIGAAGGYLIDGLLSVSGGAGGIQFDVNYSGSFSASGVSFIAADGRANSAAANFATHTVNTVANSAGFSQATLASSGDWVRVTGFLNAIGTGTFGLSWAQNSSSGTGTTIKRGSWLRLTQAASV